VNSKARSHLSLTFHSKYLLPPVERKEVDDVEAVESVRVTGVNVMLQDAAVPQVHRTCCKCVAVTAQECGKVALVRRSQITLGDRFVKQIL